MILVRGTLGLESIFPELADQKYFISLSDEKMNPLIQSTAKMDLEKFDTLKLIKEIMKRNPALVAELAAQITQGALKRVLGSGDLRRLFEFYGWYSVYWRQNRDFFIQKSMIF